jgi:hypothetical protein
MTNILTLIGLDFKSYLRKLLYDFSREIVIITSTAVLCALFFYIFGDFISDKLKDIPRARVNTIASYIAVAFTIVSHFFWYKLIISNKLAKDSLYQTFLRLGQEKMGLQVYLCLSFILECSIFFYLFDYAVNKWIYAFSLNDWLQLEVLLSTLVPICYFMNSSQKSKEVSSVKSINFQASNSALYKWRYSQLLFRNRASQVCLVIAALFTFSLCYFSYSSINSSALILLSMLISLGLTWALAFQLQEDMNHSWIEKILGVSQDELENCYLLLALFLSIPTSLILASLSYLARSDALLSFQVAAICISGPICFNAIMFQIDPRRPLIQILSSLLIIIFIGTAIFAHPLAVLLIPILIYYGKTHQVDQFYTY